MIDFELPDTKMLYGRCVAQQSNYWGFKLHLAISLQGVVRRAYLSPASEHDLTAAIPLLAPELILGDKGYIGLEKYINSVENQVITPKRSNQIIQNTPHEKYLLRRSRKRVETVNALLSDCIDLKKHRAKSKWGLQTRIALKLLAFNTLVLFNLCLGIPPLKINQLIH
jgi:IS5 family transposase